MAEWIAAILALGASAGVLPSCPMELFRITRNTNANVVVYEARLAADGSLDADEPVHASWLMLAEDGHREELGLLEEELAYGVEAHAPANGTGAVVSVRARPGLAIRVMLENGCPVARARVAGRDVRLTRIDVAATGGLVPGVDHVDVVGREFPGGAVVEERIFPWR